MAILMGGDGSQRFLRRGLRGRRPSPFLVPLAVALLFPCAVHGAALDGDEASARMYAWMDRHPVMEQAAGRAIEGIVAFPAEDAPYRVYVVALSPQGYVVLNSDDRLPTAVAFSPDSRVSLDDDPGNAFRAALLAHVGQAEARLGTLSDGDPAEPVPAGAPPAAESGPEICGPYLQASWNQNHPYNMDCPEAPGAGSSYRGRAPAGCTPAAYAQVLHYHRWPLYGRGTHGYIDSSGSVTGPHEALFSDPFGWSAMSAAYDPLADSQPGDADVADLMYRLGVAAEADYEGGGTGASIVQLGQRIAEHLHYGETAHHATQADLLPALRDDLRAGFPAVVSIPNHAVVADGLLIDGDGESYHINYGWGGQNNGWFSANGVPGGPLQHGVTSIRPCLMAVPTQRHMGAIEGAPVELDWVLPVKREGEAARIVVRQLAPQDGTWSSAADGFEHAVSAGWTVRPGGRTGNCWHAGPDGHAVLTLSDQFVPDAAASLGFWLKYRLVNETLTVSASSDEGESFTTLSQFGGGYQSSFHFKSVPLGAYAGERIQIRFELLRNYSFYTDGGVWLDDLAIAPGAWLRWEDLAEDTDLASRRFSEERTLLDACGDFAVFELTSTSSFKDWTVGADGVFYKEPGGYSTREYHLTSRSTVVPAANTRLLLRWKRDLAYDRFRVLVSSDRSSFTEVWSAAGGSEWTEQAVLLGAYAGQPVYLRLEYLPDSYYPDGGVWIDTLWLQDVVNPELEGQPVHYTVLAGLPAGTYMLAAVVEDASGTPHPPSPSFQLEVLNLFATREEADGSVTVTGYNGAEARVAIPSQIGGKPVRGVAENAFAGTDAAVIVLPAGVAWLEDGAFAGAPGLLRIYCRGDAPSFGGNPFPDSAPAVYVLLGASGWGQTFAGRPVMPWNPLLHGVVGITPEGLRIEFSGPPDDTALVEVCDDLAEGVWNTVRTNVLAGGEGSFTDPAWTNHPARFYRVLLQAP